MHPFVIDAKGSMYVDVATATNSRQVKNRTLKSPGVDPCTELETRGGIWLHDAEKTNHFLRTGRRMRWPTTMKNSSQSTIAAVYLSRFTAWLWSDGSFARIAKTITEGVSQPKQYRSPVPAMGGAQLTPDQVSAVAAYVWSLSHWAVRGSGNHVDHP
jgi:hypothetical protein